MTTHLHSIQNAAPVWSREVDEVEWLHHAGCYISCSGFWVQKRVDFKVASLVYRSLSSMAPASLAADCQLLCIEGQKVIVSCILSSPGRVSRWMYSHFGYSCYAAAGPKLWNSQLVHMRQTNISFDQFKYFYFLTEKVWKKAV